MDNTSTNNENTDPSVHVLFREINNLIQKEKQLDYKIATTNCKLTLNILIKNKIVLIQKKEDIKKLAKIIYNKSLNN